MTGRYTLKVLVDFAASHALRGYPGDCARLHGHNWKVEVEVTASALDELGMAMDFKTIRQAAREVVDRLDHRHLNDLPPFDRLNPTAEHIARHIFQALAERLDDARVRVSAVTVWETDRACARYSEDETAP